MQNFLDKVVIIVEELLFADRDQVLLKQRFAYQMLSYAKAVKSTLTYADKLLRYFNMNLLYEVYFIVHRRYYDG